MAKRFWMSMGALSLLCSACVAEPPPPEVETTVSGVSVPCSDAVISIRCEGESGCVGARVCAGGELADCECADLSEAAGEGAVVAGQECSDDSGCGAGGLCADDPAAEGYCALECDHDGMCAEGQVCGLAANGDADRIDRICQLPLGGGTHETTCSSPSDCIHGLCVAQGSRCSQMCRSGADCPDGQPRCVRAGLPVPGAAVVQELKICRR